jgi:hypothetical protein
MKEHKIRKYGAEKVTLHVIYSCTKSRDNSDKSKEIDQVDKQQIL